ncbi:MAG: DUF4886 domain-containing protein [Ruminococcaceae bacterium]|nr:DUF4886 domain-containing protein [Oscillospiraceae bacterium]
MKILCIGNSFSQDATKYLHQISDGEIFVRNLYIGGCSLETHWNNIVGANKFYGSQDNGGDAERNTSINEALLEDDWDFITVQQVSHFSGLPETYEPFLTNVLNFIREKCPRAEIAFHRTWAYDDKSDHFGFAYYDRSRQKMNEAIIKTSSHFASVHGLRTIPNCEAIESARALPEFQGELNMNRDGFHLSLDYGRYLAGLTMYGFFTGKDATKVTYEPDDTDPKINAKLKEIAKKLTFVK